MLRRQRYTVEVPDAASRDPARLSHEALARARAELERMADEVAVGQRHGGLMCTVLLDGDLSLVVRISHEQRTVSLLEMARVR